MKKSAILTFHRTTNFGALLHTIALYKKMAEYGADVDVLDYHCRFIEDKELPSHKPVWWTVKGVLYHLLFTRRLLRKERSMERDLRRYTRLSARSYTDRDVSDSNNVYDRFVVGSDVVWGLDFSNGDYTYFLDFVDDDSKKFSFSTSVGNTDRYTTDARASQLLRAFRQINVRETQAADWVKTLSGMDSNVVCDPTFLLDSSEWDDLIHPKHYKDDYVLIYFGISDAIFADAKEYASSHGLKVKHIDYQPSHHGVKRVRPYSLAQFLGLIKNARMVFTDSYHGLLFAINYNRQVRFYNRGGSSRMSSIASILGMERADASLCPLSEDYQIDYTEVNRRLASFREASIERLKGIIV